MATETLNVGQVVCHYHGRWYSGNDAVSVYPDAVKAGVDSSYLLCFRHPPGGEHFAIDAPVDDGSQGRLINHARAHPNIRPTPMEIRGTLYVVFVVIREVLPGEELLYDYGERATGDRPPWLNTCSCPRCSRKQRKRRRDE